MYFLTIKLVPEGFERIHLLYSRGWLYADELCDEITELVKRDDWATFEVHYRGPVTAEATTVK